MAEIICPRCQTPSLNELIPVDQGIRQKLKVIQPEMSLPNTICSKCRGELSEMIGQNSIVLINDKVKDDSKARMWKSRVILLKKARTLMSKKSFGEAVVAYEKYLKLLETIFDVKEAGLRPELFKEKMATKELTIIVSVYWDLMRIYDTNEKYRARMMTTAQKLVEFGPFTPVAIEIVKKSDTYRSKSKNPEVFKNLSRELMYKKNFCFIATCVFEDKKDWHYIKKLQIFRDYVLARTHYGRLFIGFYYRVSPSIAVYLDRTRLLKPLVRLALIILIRVQSVEFKLGRNGS